MRFYDLSDKERQALVQKIQAEITVDVRNRGTIHMMKYFSDPDTYVRKAACSAIGKICKSDPATVKTIITLLHKLLEQKDELVRQSVINAAGEIGILSFVSIEHLLEIGIRDKHHKVKNAVIGSLKKMGEKNPEPVFKFVKKYAKHPDEEIRRQICHGIELRGRTHPQEALPILKELQNDQSRRVMNMLIHVVGQISYKEGCLEKVVNEILTWNNKMIVERCLKEIVEVHKQYHKFSIKSVKEVKEYMCQAIKYSKVNSSGK